LILFLVEQVICCKLMPLQVQLYKKFVETGISELGASSGKFSQSALSIITSLKKLCNRKYFDHLYEIKFIENIFRSITYF